MVEEEATGVWAGVAWASSRTAASEVTKRGRWDIFMETFIWVTLARRSALRQGKSQEAGEWRAVS